MLTAPARTKDGTAVAVVVLEPASLALLRNGKPIEVELNPLVPGLSEPVRLMLVYTADLNRFAQSLVHDHGVEAEKISVKRGH